jgi:hypothetical protein
MPIKNTSLYRLHAAHAEKLAQQAHNESVRIEMRQIAAVFRRLAQHADHVDPQAADHVIEKHEDGHGTVVPVTTPPMQGADKAEKARN